MKRLTGLTDSVYLVRFAVVLWVCYLALSLIINQSLGPPQRTSPLYYVFYGFITLVCLILAYWTWIQVRIKKAFIPLIIALTTVAPLAVNWVVIGFFPLVPPSAPDDLYLRPFPFLFVGLLLVAWQYRWPFVILVILVITGLNLGVMWSWSFMEPRRYPFQGALTFSLIQTVVYLAVGFSMSYLISRLRSQQRSLEVANLNLTHYASALDHLATSRERNRLARELHDTLAHTLSGLSVQLEAVKAYWNVDQPAAREVLEKASAAAHAGLEETRRALKALRASPLEDMGLVLSLKTLFSETAARANLDLNIHIEDNIPAFSPDIEQSIYRIAQEAATNVVNHAGAKELTVNLSYADNWLRLSIKDDGRGFDTSGPAVAGHYGITGMKERAQLMGGTLEISSAANAGTAVELVIKQESSNQSNNR